jgi:adenylate kinase
MSGKTHIVLLGGPGAGKGTQAKLLLDKLLIPQISTGDMLRAARKSGSELGTRVATIMDEGKLVSDEIVLELVQERLTQPDAANGAMFDGYPRTTGQAVALEELVSIDHVILIDVSADTLLERVTGRRTCRNCGAMFHVSFKPQAEEGVCDVCGGETYQRTDDNEQSMGKRVDAWRSTRAALVPFYSEKRLLRKVDGIGTMPEITARIEKALG